ncbi:MAG: DUF4328 domain-containing protein [Verrucomicrobiota bacterium]
MNTIHLAEPGQQPVAYPEDQARALWAQGRVTSQALYWCEGMAEWRPVTEFFGSVGLTPRPQRWAKDPATLTKILRFLLWVSLAMAIISGLLSAASIMTGRAAQMEVESISPMDILEILLGLLGLVVYITTAVFFCMWTHRANRNARALGATHLQFTPGWAVGWFFIPIANLWKPRQVMREIWHASHDPRGGPDETTPALVSNWWTLWLVTNILGQLAFRYALNADTARGLMTSEVFSLVSSFVEIGLCLVAVKLVTTIYEMQKSHAEPA